MELIYKNKKTRFVSPFIIDRGGDYYDAASDFTFSKNEWRMKKELFVRKK